MLARYAPLTVSPNDDTAALATLAAHPTNETSPQLAQTSPVTSTHGGRCPGCDYVYSEAVGDPREGFPAGTPWSAVPDTWCCPDCGVREKGDFISTEPQRA